MDMRAAVGAHDVVVEIVRQAGGELTGKSRLFQAFYLAHLFYADAEPGYLTDWPIVRMPNGPGIDASDVLLGALQARGLLRVDTVPIGPYWAAAYKLVEKVALPELPEAATKAIREAVEFVKSRSAAEMTELTHEYSRSWAEARDGQELNIYVDLIPDDAYERRRLDLEALDRRVLAAFK